MTIRGGLWKAVKEANPDLADEDVDAAVDRAVTQERDLVLKRGLNFDQARELAREELFPDHDPRDSAGPAADREAATAHGHSRPTNSGPDGIRTRPEAGASDRGLPACAATMSTRERRACAFCQRRDRKISAEHAWPSWLRTLLHAGPSTVTLAPHNRPQRSWPAPANTLGVTVKDICTHCNNGWMTKLETAAQPHLIPLLQAQRCELSRDALHVISTWVYKTAMVFDLMNAVNGLRYFTDDERHALMTTNAPPREQPLIWLAAYTGGSVATAVDYRIAYDRMKARDRTGTGEGYLSTLTAGTVALQVLTFRDSQEFPRLTLPATRWDETTIWCWPDERQTTPARWPPSYVLDNAGLSLFIDRWRPKNKPRGHE